jgi:hypothetical protein
MKMLLKFSAVLMLFLSSEFIWANTFCEPLIKPIVAEEPTSEQIHALSLYSYSEVLNDLYAGKRMGFKTEAELTEHQALVQEKIKAITGFFGYSVTAEQLLSCSNQNTSKIDFNLLRYAVYEKLKRDYIF